MDESIRRYDEQDKEWLDEMGEPFKRLIERNIERVKEWLDENVQVFPEPKSVTLSDFTVSWRKDDFSGSFRVSIDEVTIKGRFDYHLQASGKTTFNPPIFHSPLGAPASYSAVELTDKTDRAILKGLHDTFPRLEGLGWDRSTGNEITLFTPLDERVETTALENAKKTVTKDYSVTINIETV